MEIKILQVFYDKNGLPYKDKERTVHYPITSGTFLGASNTTQIRFYYDQLDELNESTFVAVSKLPNGKIGSKILESEYDSELQENYAILNLSQFYTQYKGDVFISLQGYQGGVRVKQDENGIYQIYGTPTIQATGSIKLSIAYAPTFIGSGQTENITLQRVLAELSTKLGIRQETLHVEELPTIGNPNVWYVVNDDPNDTTKANIYIWNAATQTYVWVGDNTLDLGDYYTKEQGEQFESGIDNRVTSVENELSSVAQGSPKGTYATLSDLETAYPTGTTGIYVVLADGHWYYWNGSAWTDGGIYLSTENAASKVWVRQNKVSGSPSGSYPSLSALETDFPTGNDNTYLVTANNHWYYWNGSAWTDGGLIDYNVLENKIIVLEETVLSNNTIEKENIVNILENGRLGSETPVLTMQIDANTPFKFKLIDLIGAFTNYTLYIKDDENNIRNIGYFAVNTELSLVSAYNIVSFSIYPNSTHQASGQLTFRASYNVFNNQSLENNVSKLKSKSSNFNIGYNDTNLIDRSKLIENSYIAAGGAVKTTSNLYATDFVEISDNKKYYVEYAYTGYYAYYNENRECIAYYGLNQGEIEAANEITELTPVTGSKYVRFSVYYTRIADVFLNEQNREPSKDKAWNINGSIGTYCDYTGNDIRVFSKGLCIGDSLTEGTFNYKAGGTTYYATLKNGGVLRDYSYPKKLSQISGIEINNQGIGGQTSAEWWALMSTVDFSGYDFAIIQFGVNDVSRYGGWTATSETAYTNIINKLKADNPNIKIYIATIIPSTVYTGESYDNFSSALRTFVQGLNDNNVILVDIAKYGHTGDSEAFNAGHLTAYGYWRLAQDYNNLISYLIYIDRMNYQQVQFIGTDKSFS